MRRSHLFAGIVQLIFSLGVTAALAAQGSSPEAPDSAKSSAASPTVAGFTVSGYAEASYSYSAHAVGNAIVGRLYDRFSDQFTLNALKVAFDRPFATDKLDAGMRADLLFGQNAAVTQSAGLSIGPNADITQLYVTLNVPTANGNGVQIKAGKLVSLMGLEVIEDVANPNWSEGNQFIYVESFTHSGVEVAYKFSGSADAQVRVSNGWDRAATNHNHKDVTARLGLYPSGSTSIGLLGFFGAQQGAGNGAKRYGAELLFNQKAGTTSFWLQADWGAEEANASLPDPTQDATWWAVGTWLAFDAGPNAGIALRADYLVDDQGFRTAAAFGLPAGEHKLWTATGTLNLRTWPNVLVRPEIRFDHSNAVPFDGEQSQVTFALSVAYLY